jgi:ABC-2 type transport system permease protein
MNNLGTPTPIERILRRILAIAQKETFHILRDIRTLILAFVMPVVLILIFGFAVSFDVEQTPVAILDYENSESTRAIVNSFMQSPEFNLAFSPHSYHDIERAFLKGTIQAAAIIPPDFSERLQRGERGPIQFLLDGSNGTTASSVQASANGLIQQIAPRLMTTASNTTGAPPLRAAVSMQYNPALRSALFFVPGLVAFVVAIASVLLTSLTVAREWERGNMEQLFATPVGSFEIVAGKMLPYLAVGVVQALLVLAVGTTVFDLPMRGNVALLGAAILVFILAMLGQGVLISVITKTQQLATLAAAMTTILPIILLSGFMYPVSNMPRILQLLSLLFPARYFMAILRGLMLKNSGFSDLWPQFVGLSTFSIAVILLSTLRFQRRIS